MIATFVAPEGPGAASERPNRRRSAVARACSDCQRRKVKCDGQLPCYHCRVGNVSCRYADRRWRTDRQKTLQSDNDDYVAIFRRLFGQVPASVVRECTRESLINLLVNAESGGAAQTSPGTDRDVDPSIESPSASSAVSEAVERLQLLEDGVTEGFEWDESQPDGQDAGADDVNALSLSSRARSSFLGIFSVAAVVRVLVTVLPGPIQQDKETAPGRADVGITQTPSAFSSDQPGLLPAVSYHEGQRLIDAYFSQVHVFAPMVHEPTFRGQYLSRSRKDSPWLALLYMVLALGSVASSTSDSDEDLVYYKAAQSHLGLESFASGQTETLQALILMGGLYLHYRNRPNMASVIMGAANRMACGLGLHRESHGDASQRLAEIEIKRRTWWSSYVLDSWGSTTLGRPYHAAPARLDVHLPRNIIDDQSGEAPASEPTIHSPLIYNIALSNIMDQIQTRLQRSPILDPNEISHYDKMLTNWFHKLPTFMRMSNPCPESLKVIRAVFTWRYQNIRILLHRAVILDATMRRTSIVKLEPREQKVVETCRQLAAESILSIKSGWQPTKMSGWNAVWFLFQACLIPLMALATEPPEESQISTWRAQVQSGIELCGEMAPWSLVGQKTKSVLIHLLNATERLRTGSMASSSGTMTATLPNNMTQAFYYADWTDVMGVDDLGMGFDSTQLDSATQLFGGHDLSM